MKSPEYSQKNITSTVTEEMIKNAEVYKFQSQTLIENVGSVSPLRYLLELLSCLSTVQLVYVLQKVDELQLDTFGNLTRTTGEELCSGQITHD